MPQLNILRSNFRSWFTVTADQAVRLRASRNASMSSVVIARQRLIAERQGRHPLHGRTKALIFLQSVLVISGSDQMHAPTLTPGLREGTEGKRW